MWCYIKDMGWCNIDLATVDICATTVVAKLNVAMAMRRYP